MRLLYTCGVSPRLEGSLCHSLSLWFLGARACAKIARASQNASLHLFTHLPVARARSLCTRKPENSKQSETQSATIAVYWAGPALGAVLGTGLFKAAYKGESKKKSKRKTR